MAGEKDKATGSVKEGLGDLTGDERLKAEGKTDKTKGNVKEGLHDLKEAAKGVGDSATKK